VVRALLNIVRSIETLMWAIVFVVWVGVGPFGGMLALTLHTIAALGKLYSEAIESIDPGPIEAIRATGANFPQMIVYGVLPQIVPTFLSFTLYRWDINVRLSTVIGLVSDAGLGFLVIQWIRLNRLRSMATAIIAIVLVVVNVARVLPGSWDRRFEGSTVAEAIAGPDAIPQRVFERFAPDGVLGSLAAIQGIFGANRAVPEGSEVLSIPPAGADEVRQVREETGSVLERVNEHRAGQGLSALGRSASLDAIAESRAIGMYTTGRLSREHPPGGNVATDVATAGIRLVAVGENLALASSTRAAFDAMLDSPTALTQFSIPAYDRAGLSIVDGPTGRLVVIVMGG